MTISSNLSTIQKQIQESCKHSQRNADDVCLIAVSKRKPASAIDEAYQVGQLCFGENYVQEWQEKAEELQSLSTISWHFIGRLQKNKCRKIVGHVDFIHTVDSVSLLQEIEKRATPENPQKVLLQANLAGEETKSGFKNYQQLQEIFQQSWSCVSIQGLMCIPPFTSNREETQEHFRELRETKVALEKEFGLELPHLSMGMSSDFDLAIQEGATFIRVGSAIFGAR